jgi:uncharacterized protein (TIGR04376 family)
VSLFEDLSRFLESRLEEFLRNNPHLELQALEEQLREQEEDTRRLIAELKLQEKKVEEEIFNTAQEVQRWHIRIDKAKAANRIDLIQPAQEHEAGLLRQGNQLWGHMKGVKERITKTQELYQQIQVRRQEVRAKAAEAEAARASAKAGAQKQNVAWNQGSTFKSTSGMDSLEAEFSRWEAQEELEEMKKNLGR